MDLLSEDNSREIRLINGEVETRPNTSNAVRACPRSLLMLSLLMLSDRLFRLSSMWFLLDILYEANILQLAEDLSFVSLSLFLVHLLFHLTQAALTLRHYRAEESSVNTEPQQVWRSQAFTTVLCEQVRVGDCVLITGGVRVPADVLLLATSGDTGNCHVSNNGILGENSLEAKTALRETQRILPLGGSPAVFSIPQLSVTVRVQAPNPDFLSFTGSIKLRYVPRSIPLKPDNFVLKGSTLKSEAWALGLVLYAGMETKYWSNIKHFARRPSFLERILNRWMACCVFIIFGLAGLGVLLQYTCSRRKVESVDFVHYLALYHTIVPLYLIVALDGLRVLHRWKCGSDTATVNASCLVEDLGTVSCILADKTGTMTQSRLELLTVLVDSQLYSKDPIILPGELIDNSYILEGFGSYVQRSSLSFDDLRERIRSSPDNETLQRFCECIALCNNVVSTSSGRLLATSADEEALMEGVRELGFSLYDHKRKTIQILIFGECVEFEVVCAKNLSSDSGRIRVIVKQEVTPSQATLFVKGSYAALGPLLTLTNEARGVLERKLSILSEKGLRTMVMGCRVLEGEDLAEIESRVATITSSRIVESVQGNLEVLFLELEKKLNFLGVTGVTDQTHTGAAEAVATLKTAGVATWLISGESELETLACAHELAMIPSNVPLLSLSGLRKSEDCLVRLSEAVNSSIPLDLNQTDASAVTPSSETTQARKLISETFAVSMDGESLQTAMQLEETQRMLLSLLLSAAAVSFHSMHPSHKREVALLRRHAHLSDSCVLAIGDGASDVPMLCQSDISVGLRSSEAERVSDISVASFADLPRLILTEGRRTSAQLFRVMRLFVYAEVMLATGVFAFTLVADFTPVALVAGDCLSLFEGVLSFLPVVALDVIPRTTAQHCALPENRYAVFAKSIVVAVAQCAVVVAMLATACFDGFATSVTLDELSFLYLATVAAVVSVHCLIETTDKWLFRVLVQTAAYGCLMVYYCANPDGRAVVFAVFATPKFVLGLVGAVFACALISVSLKSAPTSQDSGRFSRSKVVTPRQLRQSDLKLIKLPTQSLVRMSLIRSLRSYKEAKDQYAIRTWMATFQNTQTERRFQTAFLKRNAKLYWVLLGLVLAQATVPFFIDRVLEETISLDTVLESTGVIAAGLLVVAFAMRNIARYSAQLFALGLTVAAFIASVLTSGVSSCIFFYITVCLLLFLREKWATNTVLAIVATLLLLCSEAVLLGPGSWEERMVIALGTITVQLFTLVLAARISYQKAMMVREQFKLIEQCKAKIEQSSEILSCLLPDFVCKLVKDGLMYTADDQGDVSVIFIDICMFDEICSAYSPPELISLLDEVFQRIDELCSSLQVAKIETVGKTYLACAGLRDFEFQEIGDYFPVSHAHRALDLATAVIRSFRTMTLMHGHSLSFKIGIHSGPVIAGVVGHHKPQFVLVGDTVNTASRMASTLHCCNCVQISEATHQFVKDRAEFEFRQRTVQVKGKGEMLTFIVSAAQKQRLAAWLDSSGMRTSAQRTRRNTSVSIHDFYNNVEVRQDLSETGRRWTWGLREQETDYCLQKRLRLQDRIRLGLGLFSTGMCGIFLARTLLESAGEDVRHVIPSLSYVLLALLGFGTMFFLTDLIRYSVLPWTLAVMYCSASITVSIECDTWSVLTNNFVSLIIGFLILLVNFASGLPFFASVLVTLATLTLRLLQIGDNAKLECDLFYLLFAIQCCVYHFASEYRQRAFYSLSKLAMREIEKTEQLLTQMIPIRAYESLRHSQWTTDRLNSVSILFADISGFTSWASAQTPEKVIEKLSAIFTAFDKICVKRELYKVCTIGDCYVALSSTSNEDSRNAGEECVRMVKAAFEMNETLGLLVNHDSDGLQMRIGVHVGEVVAGITGSRIVRYDIYGPDVTLANKMESSGAVSRVNVSEAVKSLLERSSRDEFSFERNKKVDVPEIARETVAYFVSLRVKEPMSELIRAQKT